MNLMPLKQMVIEKKPLHIQELGSERERVKTVCMFSSHLNVLLIYDFINMLYYIAILYFIFCYFQKTASLIVVKCIK